MPKDDLPKSLLSLMKIPGVLECVILPTCLRLEIYLVMREGEDPRDLLGGYLREAHGCSREEIAVSLNRYEGNDVARHLFSVACGLDSNIIGEKQIVAQVKDSYRLALEHGCTGAVLNRLFQTCLCVSKRVRTRTRLDEGVCSTASLAARMLAERLGGLGSAQALILGAGQMGKLVARHLSAMGCDRICFSSRSTESAQAVAGECAAESVPFGRFFEALEKADILVTATGAPHEIISYADMRGVMERRRGMRLCVVDLADPPDVDPRVSLIEGVIFSALKDVEKKSAEMKPRRAAAALQARALVEQAVEEFGALIGRRSIPAMTRG